jgi:O-antigen ligase
LPFGGFLSVLIILWLIASWFCFDKEKAKKGLKSKWFQLMIAFFFFHVISALLSDNLQEGIKSIEIKLSFIAFPYFFFLFGFHADTIKRMVAAFVSGCFFALMACLVRATYIYYSEGQNFFFYNDFSYFIHTGYFSMYMLFGIVLLQLVYPAWFPGDKMLSPLRHFFTLMFVIGIFLCASKIGIIAFFIVMMIVLLYKFKSHLNLKITFISVFALLLLTFALYKLVPTPFERLANAFETAQSENIDKTSGESTAVRILIWKESIGIIQENFWFGTGTGDWNDVLQKRYADKGLTGALEHNLNTHNQFFQTFIALGVIGFILLLTITLGTMIYGFVRKNYILFIFSLIIILNFMVESMLQAQAGNLFYVFFLCLLLRYDLLNSYFSTAKKQA